MGEKSEDMNILDEQASCTIIGKWNSINKRLKYILIGILLASIFIVSIFATFVNSSIDIFPTGALSPSQIMVFIFSTFVLIWTFMDFMALKIFEKDNLCPSHEARIKLRSGAEFIGYLFLFFICDRTTLLPRSNKWYTADSFWFLWISLVAISLCTLKKAKNSNSNSNLTPVIINGQSTVEEFHVPPLTRNQTEEWKGWMQVLFLWYHYFHNVSIYNSIRLFIAAYVWMTGFGNFSYYYVRKDFSLARFCDMQWRLNFFVVVICLLLRNEYMLYYICPLHTLFTLFIYGSLWKFQEMNSTNRGICIKVGILFILSFLLWDLSEQFFYIIWTPFNWLLKYNDPYRPERNIMSEWYFRTFLDHYIWIYGMLFAYCHPRYDNYLKKLDELPKYLSWLIKNIIVIFLLFIGYLYVKEFYLLPKSQYVKIHPYTSFIPITIYIILRNIFKCARMYHIELFEILGKITLESYISQSHIWMVTTGLNGSPKKILRIVPEGYPMINFALTSIILCVVSFRLFYNTNIIRTFVLPYKASLSTIKINIFTISLFIFVTFIISWFISFATV